MRERIKRRDFRADINENVEEQSDGHRYTSQDANPAVTENHSHERREVGHQHADHGCNSQRNAVIQPGKEILCNSANQIAKSRVPPDGHESNRNPHATSIATELENFSQLYVIDNFHRQALVRSARFISRTTNQLKRPDAEI